MKLKLFFSSFFFYLPDLNKSTKKQTFFAAVGLVPGSRSWWVFLYLLILRKQRRRSSSSSWRESFTLKVRETQVRRRRILFMHIHILCIWIIMWCCCCLAHEYIQMSSGGSTRQLIENVFFSLSLLSLRTFFLFLSKTNTRLTRHVCNGDMGSSPPYFGPPACKAGAVSPSSWPLMYTRARRCLISLVCVCVCVCVSPSCRRRRMKTPPGGLLMIQESPSIFTPSSSSRWNLSVSFFFLFFPLLARLLIIKIP